MNFATKFNNPAVPVYYVLLAQSSLNLC